MSDESHSFRTVGASCFRAVLKPNDINRIARLFGERRCPGKRLSRNDLKCIADLIDSGGLIGSVAVELLGRKARPVRALLLDKSEATNWSLGWHQDRTIAVRERIDVPGFGPWSVKSGQLHVQPPHEITARMVTLRVHIDEVSADNAPLEVIPGSHLLGRLNNEAVEKLALDGQALSCLARSGDIWAYATAIVHASAKQRHSGRRRVLQIDYSAEDLPANLQWPGLI